MRYRIILKFHHQTRPQNYHQSYLFLTGFFILATCIGTSTPVVAASSCDDVRFIFARGAGAELGDDNAVAWRESIDATLQKSTLRYSFYELGSSPQGGYRYPASSVNNLGQMLGAYIGAGQAFTYGDSVTQGYGELQTYIRTLSVACPNMQFVLGGYSQGAMVVSRTLPQLNPSRILYAATFGDPKIYLPEGKGLIPPACRGQSRSAYRVHVPDCRAYEGILGSYRPYQPAGYDDKLGTWCNSKDVMCSSGFNLNDHISYTSGGFYTHAARVIKSHLKRAFPDKFSATPSAPWASLTHNVAILIDTTASMSYYLKKHLTAAQNLAAQVTNHGGKVAFVEFRDLNDPFNPQPRTVCDFNCNQSELSAALDQLVAMGGRDDSESALSAMMYAMNHLDWQSGATKSLILITDNDYLSPDRDGTTLSDVVQRSLELDPVNVYAVSPQWAQSAYADLVTQTNGAFFNLDRPDLWDQITNQTLYRPAVALNAPEFFGLIGDEFFFDASASVASSDSGNGNLRYDWDLDGDGVFEIQSGPAQLTKTYAQPFSDFIQVKVTDAAGRFSTMSAQLTVSASAPTPPKISQAAAQKTNPNTFEIQYQTNAERLFLSIDDAPLGYLDTTAQNFTLTDITTRATLRLTPYSSRTGRGEGITLTLDPDALETPNPQPSPPTPQPTPRPNPQPESPKVIAPIKQTSKAVIPKTPNTGTSPSRGHYVAPASYEALKERSSRARGGSAP